MGDEQRRRFVRIPVETMQTYVDRMDLRVSGDTAAALAEDVSFRIRQIADNACQFMRSSKRRRLTVEDMDMAIQSMGVEPVYGHHLDLPRQYGNLNLEQLALAYHPADDQAILNHTPLVTASWLAVEGVELGDNEVLQSAVPVTQEAAETHQPYLSLILEAVTGDDEDKRRIALATVQSKPAVANILPSLIQYLQETLANWEQLTPTQLQWVLKLCLAIFSNTELFLDPYSSFVSPLLKAILFSSSYLAVDGGMEHWHVREVAAATMAQLIKRCGGPLSISSPELCSEFQQALSQPQQSSLPVLYGVIQVLHSLGCASIAEILFPHLETLTSFLQTVKTSITKNDVSRLQEAILVSARILLTSDEQLAVKVGGGVRVQKQHSTHSSSSSSGADINSTTAIRPGGAGVESNLFGSGPLAFSASVESTVSVVQEREASPTHPDSSPFSLYDYLVDVVGEGLIVSLATTKWEPDTPTTKPPPSKPVPPNPDAVTKASLSMEEFLSREGFRPIRVELPCRAAPPPSVPRGYYRGRKPWTFNIPQPLLPTRTNVLEQKQSHRSAPHGQDTPPVLKGKCRGHHRYYRQRQSVDMASYWV